MSPRRLLPSLLMFVAIAACSTATFGAAIQAIDEASDAARAAAVRAAAVPAATASASPANAKDTSPSPGSGVELQRLEAALKRGQEVNASLRSDLAELERERAQLVQIQAVLTSGFVGALVTAVVAVAGAIVTSRNSRPDRDLKRLAVLEKLRELQAAGVAIPADIEAAYGKQKPEA